MKIEICVMCYGYEKRFNWMLSSIRDCIRVSKHEIKVNAITLKGNPKDFPLICDSFKDKFSFLKLYELSSEQFQNRGIQRNFQIEKLDSDTEAVYFADCDHLYDPLYFDELIEKALVMREHSPEETHMYTVCRTSTDDLERLEDLIAAYAYPCYIPYTIEMYLKNLQTRVTSAPGAGNTQLAFVKDLPDGTYINKNEDRDRSFFRSISYRSDRIFRRKFDQVVKLELNTKQYHLQHQRYAYNELKQQ